MSEQIAVTDALPASPLPARTQLQDWAARALEAARRAGASAAEVSLGVSCGLSVSVRLGEVEKVEFERDRELTLTVYFGYQTGTASTTEWSEPALARTVEAACAIARAAGEDPCVGLAEPELLAREFPDLDLCHPWPLAPQEAIERARACEAAAFAADARVRQSEGASLDTRHGLSLYANTHGFLGVRETTDHGLSCAAIAAGEDGAMQVGYWYSSARAPQDLETPEAVGRRAGERAAARLGARRLSTRRAPVLFTAEVARSLFGHLCAAISGGALYRRASFLLDCVGQEVFAPIVTARQQPFIPRGAASSAFDQEGVATRERVLVERGVLRGYLLGSYSARKLGLQTTGNAGGVYNLVVEPTFAGGLEQLAREMGTGLIVTELLGQGANLVTGDYSRGAAGLWVENGAIAHPVEELTIAGNLREMFGAVRAIGEDLDVRGAVRCGSVLIEALTIAGAQ
jgi:PmbA protein